MSGMRGMNGLAIIDSSTVSAVGFTGTMMRTTDAGLTWISQSGGTTRTLYGVSLVDSSTGFAVGQTGLVMRTDDAGDTWNSTTAGATNWLSVSFADHATGWIAGAGGALRKNHRRSADMGCSVVEHDAAVQQRCRGHDTDRVRRRQPGGHPRDHRWRRDLDRADVRRRHQPAGRVLPRRHNRMGSWQRRAVRKTTDGGSTWSAKPREPRARCTRCTSRTRATVGSSAPTA